MRKAMAALARLVFATAVVGALGFGGWEAVAAAGSRAQQCPEPCTNHEECVDCCEAAGSICPLPGRGICVCA